jgi:PilZ domain
MGTSSSMYDSAARRRSARLTMHLRVVVSGVNAQSQNFEERTETVEVSKYGAKIHLGQDLRVGALLSLERPDAERASKFRVVYQNPPEADNARRETGIEFVGADSFWGIQFPPDKSPWN